MTATRPGRRRSRNNHRAAVIGRKLEFSLNRWALPGGRFSGPRVPAIWPATSKHPVRKRNGRNRRAGASASRLNMLKAGWPSITPLIGPLSREEQGPARPPGPPAENPSIQAIRPPTWRVSDDLRELEPGRCCRRSGLGLRAQTPRRRSASTFATNCRVTTNCPYRRSEAGPCCHAASARVSWRRNSRSSCRR
jgi:hypothetical protein